MSASATEELRQAQLEKIALRRELDLQQAVTAKTERKLSAAEARQAELSTAEMSDIARRVLEDPDAPSVNVARQRELRKLIEEMPALRGAIEESKRREDTLREKRKAVDPAIADAAAKLAYEINHAEAREIKAAVDSVGRRVARMCAADKILELYSPVPGDCTNLPDAFSGTFVADAFRSGLTFYTRPSSLEDRAFAKSVEAETNKILQELEP